MKSSHKANESHGYWICGTCRIKYYLGSSCNKIKCIVGEDKLRQLYDKAKQQDGKYSNF